MRDYDEHAGTVEAAPQEVGRAVFNLVANAVDAMTERTGRETDEAYQPTITVLTRQAEGRVEIVVRDNGGGFPAVVEERLFEPFYTTKRTGNVGLGLSLARDAVVSHGGEIAVASEDGRGATFTITLPAQTEA